MLYIILPLLILGAVVYLVWRRSVLSDPVRRMESNEGGGEGVRTGKSAEHGSGQLDVSAPLSECPSCGSEWWPDALRCWKCGYDTRAEDSDSSS